MSHSATCSDRPARRTAATLAVAAVLLFPLTATAVSARVFLTREAALELAFGAGARIDREAVFLSEEQVSGARTLAGAGIDVRSAMVTRYVARRDGALLGTAYLDTHRVRTLEETLLIVVAPNGTVARVDVLTFREPEEYKPKDAWFDQFDDRTLDADLAVKRGIHGITGATLSANAATAAVRRVLAIHRVLAGETPR